MKDVSVILMYCEVGESVDVIECQFVCNVGLLVVLGEQLCVCLLCFIVICVCGSFDYVVVYVKYVFEIQFGVIIVLVLLLVLLIYDVLLWLEDVLFVVIL